MAEKNPSISGEISPSMAYMKSQPAANVDQAFAGACGIFARGRGQFMGRIIVLVLVLLLLGAIGLVGYAYSGWIQPDLRSVTQPVDLDVD